MSNKTILILAVVVVVLVLLYYSGNQTVQRLAAAVQNVASPPSGPTNFVNSKTLATPANPLVNQGGSVLASAPAQPGTTVVLVGSSTMNAPQTTGPLFQGQLTYTGN